jgi:hypothetical protein
MPKNSSSHRKNISQMPTFFFALPRKNINGIALPIGSCKQALANSF